MYKLNIGRKGLLYAAKIEDGCDLVAGFTEYNCDDEYTKSLEFLSRVFLESPDSGVKSFIVSTKGSESGLDHLEIITYDGDTRWKYTIKCEECDENG